MFFDLIFKLFEIKKNKNNETDETDELTKQKLPVLEYDKCKQFMPLQHGEIAYCSSVCDLSLIHI